MLSSGSRASQEDSEMSKRRLIHRAAKSRAVENTVHRRMLEADAVQCATERSVGVDVMVDAEG